MHQPCVITHLDKISDKLHVSLHLGYLWGLRKPMTFLLIRYKRIHLRHAIGSQTAIKWDGEVLHSYWLMMLLTLPVLCVSLILTHWVTCVIGPHKSLTTGAGRGGGGWFPSSHIHMCTCVCKALTYPVYGLPSGRDTPGTHCPLTPKGQCGNNIFQQTISDFEPWSSKSRQRGFPSRYYAWL